MLKWEREQMGLAVNDVADTLNINPSEIRAWEDGEAMPSLADLRRLAARYLCPVGHFFLDSPAPETEQLDFRGLDESKTRTLSYESRKKLRQFIRLMEIGSDWLGRLNASQEARIPVLKMNRPDDVAAEVHDLLGITWTAREKWQTPGEAFTGWRTAIEQRNVFVFAFILPTSEVRGASTWPERGLPGILVNHSDAEAATGRIFTLLHEFTHLLVRSAGVVCDFRGQREVETFANRVAARVIVPSDALDSRLSDPALQRLGGGWTERKLDFLRGPFHASRDTIAILLEERGLAERGYYQERRAVWEKRKPFGRGGTRRGQTKPVLKYRELGMGMSDLLLSAAGNENVSPLDVAEVLDMPLHRLPEFAKVVQAS